MSTNSLGWEHRTGNDVGNVSLSLDESLRDSRRRNFRYASGISDELFDEFNDHVDHRDEATDLSSEIAIVRSFLKRDIKILDKSNALPTDTIKQKQAKLSQIEFAIATIEARIGVISGMAATMSRIAAQQSSKIDVVLLNQMVAAVTQSVDAGLRHFEQPMVAGGTDPQMVADHISGLISSAVAEVAPGEAISGQNVLARKTEITSDMLVAEMDEYHTRGEESETASRFTGHRAVL